jgi:sulfhydrogenase subunit beta (sulfur reductase)
MPGKNASGPVVIERDALSDLFRAIRAQGYEIVGPTIRDGAIVYDHVNSDDALPVGWTDVQEPGSYRLERRGDQAVFGFAVGPHSPKKYLLKPSLRLWRAKRNERGEVTVAEDRDTPPRLALIGLRSCELHAIAIQDRVMIGGQYADPDYSARRNNLLIVAVNCTVASATCFCTSMGTGPRAEAGYDIALTEIMGRGSHQFLLEIGSETGVELMKTVPHRLADEPLIAAAS